MSIDNELADRAETGCLSPRATVACASISISNIYKHSDKRLFSTNTSLWLFGLDVISRAIVYTRSPCHIRIRTATLVPASSDVDRSAWRYYFSKYGEGNASIFYDQLVIISSD